MTTDSMPSTPTGRLAGKIAMVVGAGSSGEGWGNGKAAAVLFARQGATIFAVDRDARAAAATRDIIEAEGGTCETGEADVSRDADVAAMVAACLTRFGRIDILHNNVGISETGGPVEASEESWNRVIAIN
ncbi:SDR family NAD(P)-dependent oxidoreductase, partial [Stappia sp.]|uniref:SDR family NAD(P)-dependent oxidoreductase n=1 Tax=Stappia sp. TaxID=1870903 RepID=UPI003A99BC7F